MNTGSFTTFHYQAVKELCQLLTSLNLICIHSSIVLFDFLFHEVSLGLSMVQICIFLWSRVFVSTDSVFSISKSID